MAEKIFVRVLLFIISFVIDVRAQTLAPEPVQTCSGPMSCGENVGQEMGSFFGDLIPGLSGVPEMLTEPELKDVENKLGSSPSDMLTFDNAYTEKNNGAEAPLPVTRAFMKYRLKLNTDDRNIDFLNTNENKHLGNSGSEAKPKDVVDVELPANTKPKPKSAKKKDSSRPEAN